MILIPKLKYEKLFSFKRYYEKHNEQHANAIFLAGLNTHIPTYLQCCTKNKE